MNTVLVILILLINASPAALMVGEPFASGIAAAVTAIAGVIIGFALRRSDSNDLRRFFRPLLIAAIIPAGWMLIQMLPVTNLGWAHPVWQSAASALGTPIVGAFSIDRGLTLVTLCNYIVAVAIMFVAAAVAVDRHRAKWILAALSGATTLTAIIVVMQEIAGIRLLTDLNGRVAHDAAIDSVALGGVLCATAAIASLDRSKNARSNLSIATSERPPLTVSLAISAICASVLVCFGTAHVLFAVAFGLGMFLVVATSRRFGLNSWGIAGIASMMILVTSSIAIITQPRISSFDVTLAFADAPGSLLSLTERILADVSWTGSGAGTFKALVPIYKDAGELVDGWAPTLVAAISVELGRPALWTSLGIAAFCVVLLVRGGFARFRNWFYPAAGASCLCTATLLAFSNVGLSATPSLIILASTLGMAFGQSQSRAPPQLSELSDFVDAFTLKRGVISEDRSGMPTSSGV